jgi:putative tributyrin esterase
VSIANATFFSPILGKQIQMNLILPDKGRGPFPVFYLLHGRSDDYSAWMRWTRIENYAAELPLIIAMPDGLLGFYCDNVEGSAYARYMLEDVIGFVERFFPAQRSRSGRCIGGLSMGGYGALHLAFLKPELFVSANSHSGALGHGSKRVDTDKSPEFKRVFGKRAQTTGSARDLFSQIQKLKKQGARLPKMRIDCGTEDSLLEHNRAYHAHLEKLGVAHEYEEFPGVHDWQYWDIHIREALEFHAKALGIKK